MGAQHRFHMLLAAMAIIVALPAYGITLQAAQVAGALGKQGLLLPVSLVGSSGQTVSAIQFDIQLDPKQFELTAAENGPSADAADKMAFLGDLGQGRYRVVIAGINQNAIPSGVVVQLVFRVRSLAAGGTFPADLDDVIFSDPQGQPLQGRSIDGAITVFRRWHSADLSQDYAVSFQELLRVIQLFNSQAYHCNATSEDGFAIGPGARGCAPHSSDFNPADWKVNISELLRLIQFYNASSYQLAVGTEDGFMPGIPGS